MHLVIQPDGRTSRHGDMGDIRTDITVAHLTDRERVRRSLGRQQVLPLRAPADAYGRYTLWVAKWTITHAAHIVNVPAALFGAQLGLRAAPVAGPVVVTYTSINPAGDGDGLAYAESLVEDITRVTCGLPPCMSVDPAWPQAVRLAAAVLRGTPRQAAGPLTDHDAVAFLMRELGLELV